MRHPDTAESVVPVEPVAENDDMANPVSCDPPSHAEEMNHWMDGGGTA